MGGIRNGAGTNGDDGLGPVGLCDSKGGGRLWILGLFAPLVGPGLTVTVTFGGSKGLTFLAFSNAIWLGVFRVILTSGLLDL